MPHRSSSANCRTPPSRSSPNCTQSPTRTRPSDSWPTSTRRATPRCGATSAGSRTGTSSPSRASAAPRWSSGRSPGWKTTSPLMSPRRIPCWHGVTRGSATCSTRISGRSPCWTGRWPLSVPANSTSHGSSSRTWSSRSCAAWPECPGCPTYCARTTCAPPTTKLTGIESRRPAVVLHLLRGGVVLRVHAHRGAPGALR